jgi:hypothetical protein
MGVAMLKKRHDSISENATAPLDAPFDPPWNPALRSAAISSNFSLSNIKMAEKRPTFQNVRVALGT